MFTEHLCVTRCNAPRRLAGEAYLHSRASWLTTAHPSLRRRCNRWQRWDGCTGSLLEFLSVVRETRLFFNRSLFCSIRNHNDNSRICRFTSPSVRTPQWNCINPCIRALATLSGHMLWEISPYLFHSPIARPCWSGIFPGWFSLWRHAPVWVCRGLPAPQLWPRCLEAQPQHSHENSHHTHLEENS